MEMMKSPTRHSSLWCLLTEHRSTLSVFCCRAVWEMATLNTSPNNRDSAAGWTFVRNRQLTSVEEGSRATLKYLQRTRMKWISLVQLYWIHSWCLKVSAWERSTGTRTSSQPKALLPPRSSCSGARRLCS